MSSINNNTGSYSSHNDDTAPNAQQLAQQRLAQEIRKNSNKVLNKNDKAAGLDIIKMVGMNPDEMAAAVAQNPLLATQAATLGAAASELGTVGVGGNAATTAAHASTQAEAVDATSATSATGNTKSNKYSAQGAVASLPPPATPEAVITPRTQALYSSMHSDINQALGNVQKGVEPINWKALTPTMTATNSPQASAAAVDAATKGAMSTLNTIADQYKKVSSDAMTMAFLMLRSQGQSDSLNISSQMSDMQSAIREADLNQQIKADKEAQVKLDKAAKKQAVMKKVGPIMEAIIAVLTAILVVVSVGSATGLALTLAAMAIGFVAGGAVGGDKKGTGFDLESAFTGMSVAAMVVPVGGIAMRIMSSIREAVEVGIAETLKQATKKSISAVKSIGTTKSSAQASRTTDAAMATGSAADSLTFTQKSAEDMVAKTSSKMLKKAQERASEASSRVSETMSQAGAQAGEQTTSLVQKSANGITAKFNELIPQELRAFFTNIQNGLDSVKKATPNISLIPGQKMAQSLEYLMLGGAAATQIAQGVGNYSVSKPNIEAQQLLLEGKRWGLMAKVAQDSFKGTQDFLSAMQEQHNSGITQIQQMLAAHNQVASKAISNISA